MKPMFFRTRKTRTRSDIQIRTNLLILMNNFKGLNGGGFLLSTVSWLLRAVWFSMHDLVLNFSNKHAENSNQILASRKIGKHMDIDDMKHLETHKITQENISIEHASTSKLMNTYDHTHVYAYTCYLHIHIL